MKKWIAFDDDKMTQLIDIKKRFLWGEADALETEQRIKLLGTVTPEAFAYAEQSLGEVGVTDEMLENKLEALIALFKNALEVKWPDLLPGHPIQSYLDENKALLRVLDQMDALLQGKFILNPWLECYEKLLEIEKHFDRKQNQIFPYLEKEGFDKPTTVMWTLDNAIKKDVKRLYALLLNGHEIDVDAFLLEQPSVIRAVREMIYKEENILYPTALELISDETFVTISSGDGEIGFCLIPVPPLYRSEQKRESHSQIENKGYVHLGEGLLTLEQIKLIFKHLPVDISFVDENEVVRFYNDIPHRIFPRSPGVIGRKVQNCHPKESVDTVVKIIEAFKTGQKDHAEFWLELGGKFLHIQYFAVHDDQMRFKGILEVMQDATRVRSLTGSNRLLSWETKGQMPKTNEKKESHHDVMAGDQSIHSYS